MITMPTDAEPFLPFGLPSIGEEEIAAVVDCLRSGWLTTGPRVKRFEADFADYAGSRHAVALNSGTAALHLALEAIGVGPADEVLVPAMTFAATAEVVRYMGARPVLLDCDPDTMNLDADAMEAFLRDQCEPGERGALNRRTGARVEAVMPVHVGGLACDMARIMALANEYGVLVVEDVAHALPSRFQGRMLGTLGIAGAFSFYANKNITTGEGGMLVTDDGEIADRARIMSLHGISQDAWLRFTEQGAWYYEILAPGYKYNMTDIAAALGIVQLRRADDFWASRRRLARRYSGQLREVPEVQIPASGMDEDSHSWHLYVLRLNLEMLAIDRGRFISELKDRGIGTSVHYLPLHMHPYYRDTYGYCPEDLPNAAREYPRLITLPLYPLMADSDVDRVVTAVSDICHKFRN